MYTHICVQVRTTRSCNVWRLQCHEEPGVDADHSYTHTRQPSPNWLETWLAGGYFSEDFKTSIFFPYETMQCSHQDVLMHAGLLPDLYNIWKLGPCVGTSASVSFLPFLLRRFLTVLVSSLFQTCSVLARSSTPVLYSDKMRRNHTQKYLQLENKKLQPRSTTENTVNCKSSLGRIIWKILTPNYILWLFREDTGGLQIGAFSKLHLAAAQELLKSWTAQRPNWKIPLGVIQDCLIHCIVNII